MPPKSHAALYAAAKPAVSCGTRTETSPSLTPTTLTVRARCFQASITAETSRAQSMSGHFQIYLLVLCGTGPETSLPSTSPTDSTRLRPTLMISEPLWELSQMTSHHKRRTVLCATGAEPSPSLTSRTHRARDRRGTLTTAGTLRVFSLIRLKAIRFGAFYGTGTETSPSSMLRTHRLRLLTASTMGETLRALSAIRPKAVRCVALCAIGMEISPSSMPPMHCLRIASASTIADNAL